MIHFTGKVRSFLWINSQLCDNVFISLWVKKRTLKYILKHEEILFRSYVFADSTICKFSDFQGKT